MRLLKTLSEAIAISGAEDEVRDLILNAIKGHIDEISIDSLGNILALKRGSGRKRLRIMLAAHMDEVGFMVNAYTGNGKLQVAAVGGLDPRILLGKRVFVGSHKVPGVIGAKPIHKVKNSNTVVDIDNIRIDIGTTSKDSARATAPLATRIGFATQFTDLGPTARGKAFDDRVGCAILIKLLRGDAFSFDLHATFTVQEEIGLRGAGVAANAINPDAAFILEGTIADDLPRDTDHSPTTQLGKGPALSVMDRSTIYDRRLNDLLVSTAQDSKLPIQFKQPGIGSTDAGAIGKAHSGIPTAAISVPCRYIHSPAAILNKRDYRNTEKLLRLALKRLTRRTLS